MFILLINILRNLHAFFFCFCFYTSKLKINKLILLMTSKINHFSQVGCNNRS